MQDTNGLLVWQNEQLGQLCGELLEEKAALLAASQRELKQAEQREQIFQVHPHPATVNRIHVVPFASKIYSTVQGGLN